MSMARGLIKTSWWRKPIYLEIGMFSIIAESKKKKKNGYRYDVVRGSRKNNLVCIPLENLPLKHFWS